MIHSGSRARCAMVREEISRRAAISLMKQRGELDHF